MSDQHAQAGLSSVEAALKSLQPAPPSFAHDQLMYRAGRAARARQFWKWLTAAVLTGLLLGIAGTYQTLRWTLQPEVRMVYQAVPVRQAPAPAVPRPLPKVTPVPPPAAKPSWTDTPQVAWLEFEFPTQLGGYLALRQQMVRWGADQVPQPTPPAPAARQDAPSSLLDWNRELQGRQPGPQLFPSFMPFFQP